jgi:hypothetical protein
MVALHVERGYDASTSTVTVQSAVAVVSAFDTVTRTPEGILNSISKILRREGSAGDRWLGQETNVMLVIGLEHMRYFAEGGWSKRI